MEQSNSKISPIKSDGKRDSISSEIIGGREDDKTSRREYSIGARGSVIRTHQSLNSNLQSQETINTMINTQNPHYNSYMNQQLMSGNTIVTQTLQKPSYGGGILKKSGLSYQSSMSYNHQYSNQTTLRSSENKLRHVQILKNILKQAKKQRKEKKKAKKLDKRKNTFLKRGGKMQTMHKQNSSLLFGSFGGKEEDSQEESDEELDNMELRNRREMASRYVFLPDSQTKTAWDFLILCLIIQQSFIIPILICFDVEESTLSTYSQIVIDTLFMTDIVMNFNTSIYSKGILILNRQQIVAHYLKSWFLIDLVSSLPYDMVFDSLSTTLVQANNNGHQTQKEQLSGTSSILRLLRILRFMRIFKLLRVFKLQKIIITVEEYIVSDEVMFILRFAKIMITIIFFAHWMACFYFAVGYQQLDSEYTSWIIEANIKDESVGKQYIFALYWAIQTMCTVGYGDLTPQNAYERLYVTGAEILASGIYALTLNNVSQMVQKYNLLAVNYREKMMYVNQFMNKKSLPKDLKLKVWRYLQYVWEVKKQIKIEEEEVFKVLNQDLKEKITVCMNGFILQTIPFFESFEMQFVSELTFHTRKETYAMDDNIFVKDDYFGEIAFFTDEPRCATMKSRDFTDVYLIERDLFLEIAEEYDEVIRLYHEINHQIFEKQDYSLLKLECYICRKVGHRAIDCYQFHHKKGNLIQIYNRVMGRKPESMTASMSHLQMRMNRNNSKDSPQNFDIVKNKKKSSTELVGDNSMTMKSKSMFGKSIDQSDENMNESFKETTNKKSKTSNKSLQSKNSKKYAITDTQKSKKNKPINDNNDFTQMDMAFQQNSSNRHRDFQAQNSSFINTSINDQDNSLLDLPVSNKNKPKNDKQRRKSKLYENLVIKLRIEAENPTIEEESSEDSFKSTVSALDQDDDERNGLNEETKQGSYDQSRLQMPFSQTLSPDSQIEVSRLSYKIGNTLAVVPEEYEESMYSYFYGNQQGTENSQSRKGSMNNPSYRHESSNIVNQNTRLRMPSFNSTTSKKSQIFKKIQTTKTFDNPLNLIQLHNITNVNMLQVTPKLGSQRHLESDSRSQNDGSINLDNFDNNQQHSSQNYLITLINPKRDQMNESNDIMQPQNNSPIYRPSQNLLEVGQRKTILHFSTTVKKGD
eukprot:403351340